MKRKKVKGWAAKHRGELIISSVCKNKGWIPFCMDKIPSEKFSGYKIVRVEITEVTPKKRKRR